MTNAYCAKAAKEINLLLVNLDIPELTLKVTSHTVLRKLRHSPAAEWCYWLEPTIPSSSVLHS